MLKKIGRRFSEETAGSGPSQFSAVVASPLATEFTGPRIALKTTKSRAQMLQTDVISRVSVANKELKITTLDLGDLPLKTLEGKVSK